MTSASLVIFTRFPQAGKVKTRLIPKLGASGAARLQKSMTEKTVQTAVEFNKQTDVNCEVCFTGESLTEFSSWLGEKVSYAPQEEGDLGERMFRAFSRHFSEGRNHVVIIGTDCPEIEVPILNKAFSLLKEYDSIFGPARDGGYYLIGLRTSTPVLFKNINWGTGTVLKESLAATTQAGLSYALLDPLNDIDRPEDLKRLNGD